MVLQILQNRTQAVILAGAVATSVASLIFWLRIRKNSNSGKAVSLKMLPVMQRPGVYMSDPDKVERMINSMIQDGAEHLQFIADFDRTISSYEIDGEMIDTCHQALDNSEVLAADYRKRATAFRDHYYAIEINPELTNEQKIPFMVEWWTKAHNLLVGANLTRSSLTKIVSDSNIKLRAGALQLFEDIHSQNIPLLIFSAGVGDIIVEALQQRGKFYDNMKVVSNFMDFNAQDELIGFQGELIHTFNKNKSAIHKSDYFHTIKHRHNIILLGDSIGDLTMAEGAHNAQNILKIGFLNGKIEQNLELYKKSYDIVLVRDETMDIPASVLKKIISS